MEMNFRRLILERVRQELTVVSEKCLDAIKAIDRDSESTIVEALCEVAELDEKLENAMERLEILRDAEKECYMSPYLLQPCPSSLCRKTEKE